MQTQLESLESVEREESEESQNEDVVSSEQTLATINMKKPSQFLMPKLHL